MNNGVMGLCHLRVCVSLEDEASCLGAGSELGSPERRRLFLAKGTLSPAALNVWFPSIVVNCSRSRTWDSELSVALIEGHLTNNATCKLIRTKH